MSIRGKAKEALFILVLIVLTACVYSNTLDGEFVFDDSRIYNSPAVKLDHFSLAGLVDAVRQMEPVTRPVANLTFVLNYFFSGFDVRAWHLTNLGIHLLTGIIFYFLLKTTLSLPMLREKYPPADWLAFATALIWMVHPLQTQAVSYIVQRMTSLEGLFYLLSLFLYVKGRTGDTFDKRFLYFCGSAIAAIFAMGSKETAVTLPLFIVVYEWFFFQDLRIAWLMQRKMVLVGVALIGAAAISVIYGEGIAISLAEGFAKRDFTLFQRVLTEFRVLFLYLGLIAFPSPGRLSLEHDIVVSTSFFSPINTLPAIIAVIGLVGMAFAMAKRYRLPAFCILWFFGNHIVESSFLPLELVFEHRNYLPSMMVICLLVVVVHSLLKNRVMLTLLFCGLTLLLCYWTYERNFVWQDRILLWSDSVQKAPNLARAHNNLAVALKSRGRLKEAIVHYRETIRLDPKFVEAYYNLGNTMMLTGELNMAVKFYQQAVDLSPDLAVLQMSLANALFDSGRYQQAKYHYQLALLIEPGNKEAKASLNQTDMMINALQRKMQRQKTRN